MDNKFKLIDKFIKKKDELILRACNCNECKILIHSLNRIHTSDCAVHNEPMSPKGECNCEQPKLLKIIF